MAEIGATLREARMRERIDVSEIEAQTKIRAKYLRALENEEWDLLPGPTFVKSFLRTYATALGLDGKGLVEEYRLHFERPSEPPEPIVSTPRRMRVPRGSSGPGGGPSRGYMALVGIVGVVIVLLIVGLLSGGGKGGSTGTTRARTGTTAKRGAKHGSAAHRAGGTSANTVAMVSLSLRATGTVYVCLIGEGGRKLVAGQTLEAGSRTPTFHARRFELTLGNNAVALTIDGTLRTVPASSSAIGYSITKAGRRTLAPGHLPTCA
ncbi:MAG TPA: helix-turn-helix domain-containing protein [Solirubrobacteraceae bacterium]|jgi:cytoskeleton protein RodZ|nr:helix-turn-helix domain-containing protein [Solirubrobacteraceae bacterium]